MAHENGKIKLRQRKWFIILLLVLVAPVGVYFMLRYTTWSNKTKSIVASLAVLYFGLLSIGTYNTPPSVTLSNVQADTAIQTDNSVHTITGSVATIHDATIKVNGNEVPIKADNSFETKVQLEEGNNDITIEATSQKGTDTKVVKIHRTTAAEFTERQRIKDEKDLANAKSEAEKKLLTDAAAKDKADKTSKAQLVSAQGDLYKVISITDGDTIKVSISGQTQTIRMIGIDTPETKDPNKPLQCYGKEANSRMQHYAQSQYVRLEKDSSQGDKDKYGRLLRYVHLKDGKNVGYEMIRDGAAQEYTYGKPYKYQKQFKEAESLAKAENKGLWPQTTCGGNTDQKDPAVVRKEQEDAAAVAAAAAATARAKAATTQAPAYSAPQAPAQSAAPSAPSSTPTSSSYKNCTAARAAGAAPVYRGQPGYGTHLDRDGDGIGCE